MRSFLSVPTFLVFFFFAAASIAAAQDDKKTSTVGTGCAAQNILEACIKSTKAILATCGTNDWDCLCTHYTNVLTCYNNCPNDDGRFGVQSSQTANCNAAKQYGTSTSISQTASATAAKPSATTESKAEDSDAGKDKDKDGEESSKAEPGKASGESPAEAKTTGVNAAAKGVSMGMGVQMAGVIGALALVGLV
ncbi:hypothetical protein AJ79_08440 [Helicocarpus griseus UAMH5409]|uniref:Extracellular membrane protein CFEM domain-containing protein n=1 Tax=Helicocarpus griseus UAMH5409 TaxID=1447875 RepID=A0A2B7WSV9_9EURO|nr:hypothetical protein AJ79_08440 [Helicocarpus griseus UAMH5409]